MRERTREREKDRYRAGENILLLNLRRNSVKAATIIFHAPKANCWRNKQRKTKRNKFVMHSFHIDVNYGICFLLLSVFILLNKQHMASSSMFSCIVFKLTLNNCTPQLEAMKGHWSGRTSYNNSLIYSLFLKYDTMPCSSLFIWL